MTTALTSTARVATLRGERWVRQLADHLGHKAVVVDEGSARVLHLPTASCRMTWDADALHLAASAEEPEGLARVQDVVGRHLERFAAREGLTVSWSA